MEIVTLPVGQLKTNCYLLICEETNCSIILDPGGDPEFITRQISDRQTTPSYLVATHGHFDHVLGIPHLQLCLEIPFYLHPDDEHLLKMAPASARYWLKNEVPSPIPRADGHLIDQQDLEFGNQKLRVLHTPGHTPGGICLYQEKEQLLFSGDTLFRNAVGRTDLPYSDPQELTHSLKKLLSLPPETAVYPGHGPTTTLQNEQSLLAELGGSLA